MFERRHWIPPGALLFAQLSHGVSWLLLIGIGLTASITAPSLLGFAWIHVVALGWATMAALGILLHVIPTFTDSRWRNETLPRYAIVVFGVGVVTLIAGFLWERSLLAVGALLIVLALAVYCALAFATLRSAMNNEPRERAIARALGTTLVLLLATAVLGALLASMLSGDPTPAWVAFLPASHGNLGMFGWLSLLIFGVSTRTVRPITGNGPRFPVAHILTGTLAVVGIPLLVIGLAVQPVLAWIGALLFGIAGVVYALTMIDILRRAIVPHRVPQAFLAAGVGWFLVALALGAGTLLGEPWALPFVFVTLAGWVGQMLDAHIYHIGVRLLITVYRGEDDETRPGAVLDARLSWLTFVAFQLAVAAVLTGALTAIALLVTAGALCGLIGWIAMVTNLVVARNTTLRTFSLRAFS